MKDKLHTAQHILARVVMNKFPGSKVVMARFEDNSGTMDVSCSEDLKNLNLKEIESEVNNKIINGLEVKIKVLSREEAKDYDLGRLPEDVKDIRIVSIGEFDSRACKDEHVKNTSEIGRFELSKIEKVGKDRYRFVFALKQ